MKPITILERETIPLLDEGDVDTDTIPESFSDRLKSAVENSFSDLKSIDNVLLFEGNQIEARHYVGIIGTDDCVVEILPKIDFSGNESDQILETRKRLIQMLSVVYDLEIKDGALTNLLWEENPILEFLISRFIKKLIKLIRNGLPKKYIFVEEDLPKLRGALDVVRQFSRHVANPSQLACKFDEFTTNNSLNQITKATIRCLLKFTRSPNNKQQLRKLFFLFSDIDDLPVSKLLSKKIVLNRTNKRWKEVLDMATNLLKNMFQTTAHGKVSGYSFLFNMETLFEKYVGTRLKTVVGIGDYKVYTDGYSRFGLKRENDSPLFQLIPDIVVENGGADFHIIDTKWKIISAPSGDSDKDMRVASSDFYQMVTYGEAYNASQLTLVYPHNSKLGDVGLQYSGSVNEHGRNFRVFSFDLANVGTTNEEKQLLSLATCEQNRD